MNFKEFMSLRESDNNEQKTETTLRSNEAKKEVVLNFINELKKAKTDEERRAAFQKIKDHLEYLDCAGLDNEKVKKIKEIINGLKQKEEISVKTESAMLAEVETDSELKQEADNIIDILFDTPLFINNVSSGNISKDQQGILTSFLEKYADNKDLNEPEIIKALDILTDKDRKIVTKKKDIKVLLQNSDYLRKRDDRRPCVSALTFVVVISILKKCGILNNTGEFNKNKTTGNSYTNQKILEKFFDFNEQKEITEIKKQYSNIASMIKAVCNNLDKKTIDFSEFKNDSINSINKFFADGLKWTEEKQEGNNNKQEEDIPDNSANTAAERRVNDENRKEQERRIEGERYVSTSKKEEYPVPPYAFSSTEEIDSYIESLKNVYNNRIDKILNQLRNKGIHGKDSEARKKNLERTWRECLKVASKYNNTIIVEQPFSGVFDNKAYNEKDDDGKDTGRYISGAEKRAKELKKQAEKDRDIILGDADKKANKLFVKSQERITLAKRNKIENELRQYLKDVITSLKNLEETYNKKQKGGFFRQFMDGWNSDNEDPNIKRYDEKERASQTIESVKAIKHWLSRVENNDLYSIAQMLLANIINTSESPKEVMNTLKKDFSEATNNSIKTSIGMDIRKSGVIYDTSKMDCESPTEYIPKKTFTAYKNIGQLISKCFPEIMDSLNVDSLNDFRKELQTSLKPLLEKTKKYNEAIENIGKWFREADGEKNNKSITTTMHEYVKDIFTRIQNGEKLYTINELLNDVDSEGKPKNDKKLDIAVPDKYNKKPGQILGLDGSKSEKTQGQDFEFPDDKPANENPDHKSDPIKPANTEQPFNVNVEYNKLASWLKANAKYSKELDMNLGDGEKMSFNGTDPEDIALRQTFASGQLALIKSSDGKHYLIKPEMVKEFEEIKKQEKTIKDTNNNLDDTAKAIETAKTNGDNRSDSTEPKAAVTTASAGDFNPPQNMTKETQQQRLKKIVYGYDKGHYSVKSKEFY